MADNIGKRPRDAGAAACRGSCATDRLKLFDCGEAYLRQLSRYVDLDLIRKPRIPVVVDPMYGAGAGFFPQLLPGADEIHTAARIPASAASRPSRPKSIWRNWSALVKAGNYRVGLALDGDADRIGAVDENRRILLLPPDLHRAPAPPVRTEGACGAAW